MAEPLAVLVVAEDAERNECIYRHPACASWIVPLDGTDPPPGAECVECAAWLPTLRFEPDPGRKGGER